LISGEELGVKVYLSYEDERYPNLVLQSDTFGCVGYSLNLSSGELSRICVCSARSSNECVCGTWDHYSDLPNPSAYTEKYGEMK